ncbi:FGGY-family carbohydrate kinase [Labrys monachus]|uniref:Sugar (Pentulose or hexulose) kinase n=1 Tax=Labrys monachus TaxID=217067 RepID=A0ABU0FNM3_9HYPH|nr:FGGY-family carbohydrate kinase [Labrys monachus]MDQ0395673.1 sugar (pentulose or hexulose) kinase [Labrys monachus]
MTPRLLGIDVGTSGVRAALLAEGGDLVGTAAARFATIGEDPKAPQTWWRAVRLCLAELREGHDLSALRALAVDGTSGTVVAIDEAGEPVGPASMYDEPCTDDAVLARVTAEAPAGSPALGRTSGLARVLAMQDRAGVRRCLHQADWVAGRLSGRFDRSDENNALKTGYDPVARQWPAWIARTGAVLAKLPYVVEPGAAIGPVGEAGRALGLPPGTIVHAGTTDGCASFLATGADRVGDGVTALGSTLVIKLLSDAPVFEPAYGVYSHRLGDRWLVGGASNTGGRVIDSLFPGADLVALTARLRPEHPTGLDFYPLGRPGERFPVNDPGLEPRLAPRPADDALFFQAVLEGIAAIEALAYRRLAELGAPALLSVRSVGGGAGNEAWARMRQRRLGVPFEPALSQEACVGTARLLLSRPGDSAT